MKLLTASFEWCLLQSIGSLVHHRLARFKPRPKAAPVERLSVDIAFDNSLLFLDTELREILLLELTTYRLPNSTYEELQEKLKKVCELLDKAVNLPLVRSNKASLSTQTETAEATAQFYGDNGQTNSETSRPYRNLTALLEYLNGGSESADKFDLDLAHGPNQTLFIVSEKSTAKAALDAIHDCNDFLTARCKNAHSSSQAAFVSTQSTERGDDRQRERASEVLEALFAQFSECKAGHEILLHLSEDPDSTQCQQTIEMFLSGCDNPKRWQETQCLPYDDRFSVRKIQNLCKDVQAWQEGTLFPILLEHRGLFNRCDHVPLRSYLSAAPIQPLSHFMKLGYFLRDRQQAQPPDFFTPAEKQAIALKLAQCLLDYFDAGSSAPCWDSGNVYLVSPPGTRIQEGLIHVTFRSGNTYSHHCPSDIGHPVLLAFAKLLLEIDGGRAIDISQCVSSDQQWAQLCVEAQNAKRAGSGLYAEAISGCLYLHVDFPIDEDPKVELRQRIHRKIVCRLKEAAVKPSSLTEKKRRLSESPDDATSTDSYGHTTISAYQSTSAPKRQRVRASEPRHLDDSKEVRMAYTTEYEQAPGGNLHVLNGRATRPPASDKVIVFRARQVTLQDQVSISDIITDIISKNSGSIGIAALKSSIKDITPPATTSTGSPHRMNNMRRGTALLAFRNLVPDPFREIMRGNKSHRLTNGADIELSMDVDTNFIGLTQLHAPPSDSDTIADIVAIHGLNGHPYGSWLSKSTNPQMWLHDFLPEDAPNCRILIYGYESNIFDERNHPRFNLSDQADRLNASLNNIRNKSELARRPIIFLAHSFGGLILAKALITARLRNKPLHDATIGLFFFASPTRGFHVQDILDAMDAEQQDAGECALPDDKAATLVRRLGDGDFRGDLALFPDAVKGKKVYTFTEMRQTPTVTRKTGQVRRDGEVVMAAGPNSVILGLPSDMEEVIPADKDHSDIVKFASRSDETYEDIKCRIQALVQSAAQYM